MALLSLVNLTNYAQESPAGAMPEKPKRVTLTPEQKAQKQTDRMTCLLNLNESQQKKFYEYSLTRITVNGSIHKEAEKTTDEKIKKKHREQMQVNRTSFDNNVKAMLNTDQLTKWELGKQKRKAKQHHCKRNKQHFHKNKTHKKGTVEELPENK